LIKYKVQITISSLWNVRMTSIQQCACDAVSNQQVVGHLETSDWFAPARCHSNTGT